VESSPSRQTFPREGRVCFQRSDQAVSESLESHGVLPEFPALQAVKKDREHIAVTDAQRRERGSFLRPGVSSSRITVLICVSLTFMAAEHIRNILDAYAFIRFVFTAPAAAVFPAAFAVQPRREHSHQCDDVTHKFRFKGFFPCGIQNYNLCRLPTADGKDEFSSETRFSCVRTSVSTSSESSALIRRFNPGLRQLSP
jgi:hypothetical protein